jgi:two-component system, OmpR family, response regulator
MNILLVEDDDMLARAVCSGLRQRRWEVDIAPDAAAARLALLDHDYAAVLLDLRLPDASGLTVLSALRARHDVTPVLILTARDRLSDRIGGLDAGADDYLVKPFELDELYARLRALLRRSRGHVGKTLSIGDICLDPDLRQVKRAEKAVGLSVHEYRTLLALMERQRRVVSRDQLERLVYNDTDAVGSNTIAVYVHQLRRKLGEDFIETVHGFGYRVGAPQP